MTNILVLCDDQWHPAEVVIRGLKGLGGGEFNFDFVVDAKDILTPEFIASYPAIVCCKANHLSSANTAPWFTPVTEVGPKEFEAYVSSGGGFFSLHSGNTAKEGKDGWEFGAFVGNYFIGHPPRCPVDVKITGTHPIVKGVENFSIRDEHYQLTHTAGEREELFRTYSEKGGEQIGGYTRRIGKGRLCVMTPGHILSVWEHPQFRKLLVNALRWCVGQ
jgi:type 1 glutamine amidotransferase